MTISKHKINRLGEDVTTAFLDAYEGQSKSLWREIAQVIKMTTKTMEAPIRSFVGPLREWIGPRIIEQVSYDRFSFSTQKFEKTLAILRDDVEDDNIGIYKGDALDLGQQAANWEDQQIWKKLEANGTYYDGVNFFSATHPVEGGTASNLDAGSADAWYLFDLSKARKPMIWGEHTRPEITQLFNPDDPHVFWNDEFIWGCRARGVAAYGIWQLAYKSEEALDSTHFESALLEMQTRKNDQGESLGVQANLLVVPASLAGDARRLFGRNITTGGVDNEYLGAIKWVIGDRLTGV